MADKILVGRVEIKQTKFGDLTKVSFGPQDMQKLQDQASSNKGWVNLVLKQGKSGGYYLEVDTWKPKGATAGAGVAAQDDFPF